MSARMIVNQVSMKMEAERIKKLLQALKDVITTEANYENRKIID